MNGKLGTYELESIVMSGKQVELPLGLLDPSPCNSFEISDIDEMKSWIMSAGLLTPLSVIGPDEKGRYEIISGERRYTAIRELESEGLRKTDTVPCYVIGGWDMSETEKRLLIEVANITNRGSSAVHFHRFEVIRLLKELEDTEPEKYGNALESATKYLKVSDRYSRMYKQIFRCAKDDLKELAVSGNIRINDASRLSTLPEEEQKAAVEEVKTAKNAQDKSEIVSKYTGRARQEKPDFPAKSQWSLSDLDSGEYDYLLEECGEDPDLDVDGMGNAPKSEPRGCDGQYQAKLAGIIEWTEQILKKSELSDEEWDAVDACRRVAEKFQ